MVNNFSPSSQFKLVSMGTVAENKSRSTGTVEVVLTEMHPFIDGEINSTINSEEVNGTDAWGNAQSFKINTANTVSAKWKGDGTNRISPPDVRRGDMVEIYQFGDHDGYFWAAHTQPGNPNARKRETVVHAYSNTVDESQNTLNPENAWFSEINTHEKHATFKTNKADGEPFAYTVQIDAKEGNVTVCDDVGNTFQLNSQAQSLTLKTAANGVVSLVKRDLTIDVDNLNISANNGNFKIPETTWSGNTTQTGSLAITGNMTGGGGTYTFNGQLINNGKNVGDSHTHKNVQPGNGSSGDVN